MVIALDAVTNTKLANMATQTIKGRTAAGLGDPEDLTAAAQTAALLDPAIATQTEFDAHLTDTIDAHDASAISFLLGWDGSRHGCSNRDCRSSEREQASSTRPHPNQMRPWCRAPGQVMEQVGAVWACATDDVGGVTNGTNRRHQLSVGANTWTINTGVVSNTELATVATGRSKAAATAGSGPRKIC